MLRFNVQHHIIWWKHNMDTLSALLALICLKKIKQWPEVDFPHKWSAAWNVYVLFVVGPTKLLQKQSDCLMSYGTLLSIMRTQCFQYSRIVFLTMKSSGTLSIRYLLVWYRLGGGMPGIICPLSFNDWLIYSFIIVTSIDIIQYIHIKQ